MSVTTLKEALDGLLSRSAGIFAAVLLFALMAITCIDVIGRYFFNAPLVGAFEMTEVAMALLIYAALPLVTLREEHVSIDLLGTVISQRWRRVQELVVSAVSVALLVLVAWAVFQKAGSVAEVGLYTDSLRIPMAPVAYFISLVALFTAGLMAFLSISKAKTSLGQSGDQAPHQ
jgi:TRAP-type C4-dicarboxylate transport system permease small subunit